VYATVADLRAEGVTEAQATEDRLRPLLEEASLLVDRICGWWFEPRAKELRLDGRGTPTLELPAPLLRLDRLAIQGATQPAAGMDDEPAYIMIGQPLVGDFRAPSLRLVSGFFPHGWGNVRLTGILGVTEADGSLLGRTPLEIRRATMLLVMRSVARLADDASADARHRWRLLEERTKDQSYKLAPLASAAGAGGSGDPEVDAILARYRRPPAMGAV